MSRMSVGAQPGAQSQLGGPCRVQWAKGPLPPALPRPCRGGALPWLCPVPQACILSEGQRALCRPLGSLWWSKGSLVCSEISEVARVRTRTKVARWSGSRVG